MDKIKDITFHYTKPETVRDLLAITPIFPEAVVLDAGSGKNKVWYNELVRLDGSSELIHECEIEDGNDFFDWQKKVDWVVGNPPYHLSWKFTEHALNIAQKGIAWLVNNQALNSHFTPRRIELMQNAGFYLQKIHVVADKRWFGRYYYLIWTKQKNNLLTCNRTSY